MEKFAEEQGNSDRSGRSVWIVAVALFSWLGFSAGTRTLTLPDEARYVGIAWSMVQSGDWVIPSLNGFPYFHKPPLFYWLTAVSLHVFGGVQWASRMGTLLGATAGALALWSFARGRSGARLARWTLLVLGTTPLFFAGAQIASPDMLVNGCIAITICLFAEATLRASEGRVSFKLAMSGWAVAALGVLAKGLIGIVIPGLVLAGWLLFTRRLRLWRSLVSPSGIGIFLAIACPWFIAAELSHPGFAKYFFVHHHVERFLGTGFVSARSWWFYVAALPLITLPWSPWLARAVWIGPRVGLQCVPPLRSLMWTWIAVVVVFFSIPESKPVGYVESVLYPVAFLVAELICEARPNVLLVARATLALAALLSVVFVVVSGLTYDRDNRVLAETLRALRKPGDPVVFAGEFYFDVPLYAGLDRPVGVVGKWRDPRFATHDDWRRELLEASAFAPQRVPGILMDEAVGLAPLCRHAVWVVAPAGSESMYPGLASNLRVFESNGAGLWRIAPLVCP